MRIRALAPWALLGIAFACGTPPVRALAPPEPAPHAPEATPDERFPNPSQLGALPAAPAISDVLHSPLVDVDEWRLQGPFPDLVGVTPHAAANDFERLLDAAVAGRTGLAASSEPMHCAAREAGRFVLAHGALPASGLLEFIAARCGVLGSGMRPGLMTAQVPASVPDAELLAGWRGSIDELLQQSLAGGPTEAGLWFGREGDRAVLVVASGLRPALIQPFSPVAQGGVVTISGEVLENTADVFGLIDQGRFGYAPCSRDTAVSLPRFRFQCPLASGDESAMIELSALPPGRILTTPLLRTLARRPGVEASVYRRAALAEATPGTPGDIPEAVLALLNQIRRKAELPPLTLSRTQSEAAAELAPHLFAASFGLEPPAVGDLVALGLAAGWRVGGAVKDVEMTSGYTPGSRDAARWLDTVLRYPSGRQALLGPKAGVLAVGAVSSETPPVLAAVAATYQLYGKEDFAAEGRRLLERIQTNRKSGAPALQPLPAEAQQALDAVVGELPSGRLTPEAALQQAMTRVAEVLHRPVRGVALQGPGVDAMPIPDPLLGSDVKELGLSVSYFQAPDAPWGRTVALVIVAAPDVAI